MLRSVFAAALLAASPSNAPIVDPVELGPVPLVICHDGDQYVSGSAFRVGAGLFLSVNHVTSNKNCEIEGQPIRVLYHSGDFSMLADNRPGKFLKVDCGGFIEGHEYVAVGHARGADKLTVVPLIATGQMVDGYAVLVGILEFQPGMSGGPVLDSETGMIVGTINAANWEEGTSFSVALKDTIVCQGRIA